MKKFLQIGSARNAERQKTHSQKHKNSIKNNSWSVCEVRNALEFIYSTYNRKEFLSPDPLQFLYDYPRVEDREICGLLASTLAYGRVAQIIASLKKLFSITGISLRDFVEHNTKESFVRRFENFKHRFTSGKDIANLLTNAKFAIENFGSLEEAFQNCLRTTQKYTDALDQFALLLNGNCKSSNYLVPLPSRGSACKRLNLFIKWMSRKDEIDPGGWKNIPISELIIPLDTHMWQIANYLNFTKRKTADFKSAVEITNSFKLINPADPCKYDFALTRLGIRNTKKLKVFNKNS